MSNHIILTSSHVDRFISHLYYTYCNVVSHIIVMLGNNDTYVPVCNRHLSIYLCYRLHTYDSCFSAGYMENDVHNWPVSGNCVHPTDLTWFTVTLVVTDTTADVYLDGTYVTTLTSHFPAKESHGAIVANGFDNIMYFRLTCK